MEKSLEIRRIRAEDDPKVFALIHTVMPEFGACGQGFAITDPEVVAMSKAYATPQSAYFVLADGDRVVGGGGVAPLVGANPEVCELRKMYFLPEARGRGWGRKMLETCLAEARARGFQTCYLETLTNMTEAQELYQRFGFKRLDKPLGNTGHFGCDRWFALDLLEDG